jgi:hypothetical protein
MRVSFDFDGTIELEEVQQYAKELIRRGVEVWIITTRYDSNHKHRWLDKFPGMEWAKMYERNDSDPNFNVWGVAEWLGIPRHHVRFTCMEWKYTYLTGTKFVWHLDDNKEEIDRAVYHECNVPIINVTKSNWKNECEKRITGLDKRPTDL